MVNITAPYNLSAFNDATDIYQMAQASNSISGNLFGLVIVLISVFLIFVIMKGYDTKTTIVSSTSFGWLVALILFNPLEFISPQVFGAVSAIAIAAILITALNKD